MKKYFTKLGAVAMSAIMAVSFAPGAAITTLAAGSDGTTAADELTVPVYRLYRPGNGEHLFTTDERETTALSSGTEWEYEDVAWYSPASGEKISRLFNPADGEHLYTSDALEIENCKNNGWTVDSTIIYGAKATDTGAEAIYRLFNPNAVDGASAHLFTTDPVERAAAVADGWEDEGPKFYGYSDGTEVPETPEGKVLNIQLPTDLLIMLVEENYPGYVKTGDTSGKIGDIDVKFTITAPQDGAYEKNLDNLLANNATAAADDKVDIFYIEEDYAKKYIDAEANVAMKLSDLGITASDLSDQYKYTQDIVTDENGSLRASAYQVSPVALIYNRSIAKAVLGSDDPAEVQKAVSDWGKYDDTAAAIKAAGYLMTATTQDTYRLYSDHVSSPWVEKDKVTIDANITRWANDSKAKIDAGQTTGAYSWSEEWSNGFKAPGTVFCYFGPSWFYQFQMGNTPDSPWGGDDGSVSYQGGWGICEGPESAHHGGSWLCAATGTDNKTLVSEFIKNMTTDKATLRKLANFEIVNSKSILNELAISADKTEAVLGGQNPYGVFAANAEKLDLPNTCPFDAEFNELFQDIMIDDYFTGNVDSYDKAVEIFKNEVKDRYPDLSF